MTFGDIAIMWACLAVMTAPLLGMWWDFKYETCYPRRDKPKGLEALEIPHMFVIGALAAPVVAVVAVVWAVCAAALLLADTFKAVGNVFTPFVDVVERKIK